MRSLVDFIVEEILEKPFDGKGETYSLRILRLKIIQLKPVSTSSVKSIITLLVILHSIRRAKLKLNLRIYRKYDCILILL